jgi:hypothetical protein
MPGVPRRHAQLCPGRDERRRVRGLRETIHGSRSRHIKHHEHATPCTLCAYGASEGEAKAVMETVRGFIAASAGEADVRETARQIREVLRAELREEVAEDEIVEHIQSHTLDRRVVMSNVLQDLLKLARAARDSCVVVCEESGHTSVDTKVVASYLKTVEAIASVYRSGALEGAQ